MGGQIIPWNVSVVFAAATLGVSQFDFIPFVFVCILVPIISMIYAVTGFTIVRVEDDPGGSLDEDLVPVAAGADAR
jgi:NhaC family Na+:H+ antiporter